jgi:hypothetical protein
MTSLEGYQGIARCRAVFPSNEGTDFSFTESKLSNCYELKAVSLWDFELPSPTVTFDDLLLRKCETVLLRHQPAIFIGFARDRLMPNLKYYEEIKRVCGLGGIVPGVEVCHVGQIRLDLAMHIVATSLQNGRLRIQRKQGWAISEKELELISFKQN